MNRYYRLKKEGICVNCGKRKVARHKVTKEWITRCRKCVNTGLWNY